MKEHGGVSPYLEGRHPLLWRKGDTIPTPGMMMNGQSPVPAVGNLSILGNGQSILDDDDAGAAIAPIVTRPAPGVKTTPATATAGI